MRGPEARHQSTRRQLASFEIYSVSAAINRQNSQHHEQNENHVADSHVPYSLLIIGPTHRFSQFRRRFPIG